MAPYTSETMRQEGQKRMLMLFDTDRGGEGPQTGGEYQPPAMGQVSSRDFQGD
jgi:hypothetical protein